MALGVCSLLVRSLFQAVRSPAHKMSGTSGGAGAGGDGGGLLPPRPLAAQLRVVAVSCDPQSSTQRRVQMLSGVGVSALEEIVEGAGDSSTDTGACRSAACVLVRQTAVLYA
jgi:hypothetical protein